MWRKTCFISILLAGIVAFSACNNTFSSTIPSSAPTNEKITEESASEIVLKVGGEPIASIAKSNTLDNTYNDNLFKSIMSKNTATNIAYVKLGEEVQVEFKNKVANTYSLEDYILNEDGTLKYTEPTKEKIDIKFNNGLGSFVLKENSWVNASSELKDYEPGKTLRGFKLKCPDAKKEYVFIIKTDAKKK